MSIAVGREAPPPILGPPEGSCSAPAETVGGQEPSAFGALLQSLAGEIHRGEALTRSALGLSAARQAMGPAELIALQAGIYRYAEAVDLASRLVDRATSAVKTVAQGS